VFRHVVLLGLMGAGKTVVGRGLAARLGWPVRDSDADILAATGRTARQIDEQAGTVELHRLEARQLIDAIAAPEPSVVCAAASAIDDAAARAALGVAGVAVVWLRADPATLARRAGGSDHRRSLGADAARALAEQAAARYPRFLAQGPFVVDVDDRPVGEVIAMIATHLGAAVR
jgi:shikimate kinase